MRRRLALAGMVALLVGGAACAETPEPERPDAQTPKPAQDNSIEAIRTRAIAGEADAQAVLGFMYYDGEGVPQDDVEAVVWYRQGAEQGHAGAQVNLGAMYATGEGVPQDDVEAVAWWRKSAEQGHAGAQVNLGAMYDTGRGVPQDDTEAVAWYRQAAEQGHAEAQFNLGVTVLQRRGRTAGRR